MVQGYGAMTLFADILDIVYTMLVQDILGHTILLGLGIMFLYGYAAFKFRLSFTATGIGIVSLALLFSATGIFPVWILAVVVMMVALIIGLGLIKVGRR